MRHAWVSVLLPAFLLIACGEHPSTSSTQPAAQPSPADAVPDPDALHEVIDAWVKAQNAGDTDRFLEITRAFVPTRAELRSMLREGAAADAFVADAKGLTRDDSDVAKAPPAGRSLRKTKRTDIFVHVATSEEIAEYKRGTVAFAEFPGGMRRFAQTLAAPGRIWYAVELREPGHSSGTRITAFTRLGGRFFIVPKPWRSMSSDAVAGPSK